MEATECISASPGSEKIYTWKGTMIAQTWTDETSVIPVAVVRYYITKTSNQKQEDIKRDYWHMSSVQRNAYILGNE